MKKIIIIAMGIFISINFIGCGRTAQPNLYNGKYYMSGDSNCVRGRPLSSSRIMCIDSNGNETGYRDAMTDQDISMYQHNRNIEQQRINQYNQSMSNMNSQMNYNNQQMLNRNNTYKVKIVKPYGY